MNANHWWCMDCLAEVELDTHGRCGSCESEAVDSVDERAGLIRPVSLVQTNATNVYSYRYASQ
jgi:Zn finger protein HypA/HybF involved in hydrogenase expression